MCRVLCPYFDVNDIFSNKAEFLVFFKQINRILRRHLFDNNDLYYFFNGYRFSLIKREVQEIRFHELTLIKTLSHLPERCDGVRLLKAYIMFSSNIKTFLALMFFIYRVLCLISIFFLPIKENPVRSAIQIDFDWNKGRT